MKRIISLKNFLTEFHLSQKFNVIATSKTKEGKEYVSIVEGKKILNHKTMDKKVHNICSEYIDMQEAYIEKLKEYL